MNFPNRLKEIRITKGLNQKELAKLIDVDISSISYWESGKYEPKLSYLVKLANVLNVSLDYLSGNQDYDYTFEYQHENTKLVHKEKKRG